LGFFVENQLKVKKFLPNWKDLMKTGPVSLNLNPLVNLRRGAIT
jgi:hypothetical protein